MSWKKVDIQAVIDDECQEDAEFHKEWTESRKEYELLGELAKLRKSLGISQTELAKRVGKKQQMISRIESFDCSPTLRTICTIADVMGYELKLVPVEE